MKEESKTESKLDAQVVESNLNEFFKEAAITNNNNENKKVVISNNKPNNIISTSNQTSGNIRNQSRPRTAYKKVSIGRDEKIDSDLYYRLKDENEYLKKHQIGLNDDIKRITTALEKVKHGVLLERKLSDRKVIRVDGGYDVEVENLKLDKEKLAEKLKKMSTIIKGLQSQTVNSKSLGRKNLIQAKTSLDNQNEKNEYLKIIHTLKDRLKISDNEIKRISDDVHTPKNFKNMSDYSKDMHSKNTLMSELQSKYEKTQMQFETNIKILEHTKATLEEYISKYNEERKKNLELENRMLLTESNLTKLPEYVSLIDEYKAKEKHLEDRIKDLCENPFIKQAEERGNVYRKLQESELSLNEAKRRLNLLEETNKTLDKDNKTLKDKLNLSEIERDKFKEEVLRFRISSEEKEKHSKHFEDQFKLLGQYGEVDSNFTKILNILKLKEDNNSWSKLDLLEKMKEPEIKDPVYLMKEIERLKIEKGILGSELEKTKSLLQIQQQINEDHIKLSEEDKQILKLQNEKLMKKCEDLAKLVDIKRLSSTGLSGSKATKGGYLQSGEYLRSIDSLKDYHSLVSEHNRDNLLSDSITEFSRDETDTEFGINENALDLYIGEAHFEEGLEKEIGVSLNSIMSLLSVDFYLHDTITSNLISGKSPVYNLQLSFRVTIDEKFIHYLESDSILLDIYLLKDNVQFLLGKGKVKLADLVTGDMNNVTEGICTIYYTKDQNLKIGSLHYKMRMRSPLSETVKWYQERDVMINSLSPVHNLMSRRVQKELKSIENIVSKIMSVTIMITKAVSLKVSGAPRKVSPYIYYQFYKFDDHFSDTQIGNDPLFQDVMKYDLVYDNSFHEYIEKEEIHFYVLDNSRPLSVQMRSENKIETVNLIDDPDYDDLIGVCKISLRELLINDLIQSSFPIYNKNNSHSGDLIINIFWESLEKGGDLPNDKHDTLPYEANVWEDKLIIGLANTLKNKGLSLNSAFEIFDRDSKGMISILNFKDTVLFTFKFTENGHELESLTKLIFKERSILNKLDFFKIFAIHLPHEGPLEEALERKYNSNKNIKGEENKVVDNISLNFIPEKSKNNINENFVEKDTNNVISFRNAEVSANNSNIIVSHANKTKSQNNLIFDSNRSMKDIVKKINEYMGKASKSTPLELYKMFDRDADLKIGKHELANGLSKLGIPVSSTELERIWKDITENNSRLEKFDYRLFKAFYERYDMKIKAN